MPLAKSKIRLSLTPGFSRVMVAARTRKPFQRFAARGIETVETVSRDPTRLSTPLKRGVSESGARKPAVTRYG